MKIEIEIPDLEEIYLGNDDDFREEAKCTDEKELKQALVNAATEKFINELYNDYMTDKVYSGMTDQAKKVVKDHSEEIINKVVDIVSQKILDKKAIAEQMPKKSEIANINKDWENYFMELIDKAIAKRFR